MHALSGRSGPLVPVNCGAIPGTLLEGQLFGHVRGAFSGAVRDELGLVRAADGGTLFLDEIGDLPATSQAALLRVLQEGEVQPVGATRAMKVRDPRSRSDAPRARRPRERGAIPERPLCTPERLFAPGPYASRQDRGSPALTPGDLAASRAERRGGDHDRAGGAAGVPTVRVAAQYPPATPDARARSCPRARRAASSSGISLREIAAARGDGREAGAARSATARCTRKRFDAS